MLGTGPVVAASFLYISLLFGIAWWADRRARRGSVIASPLVYALSLAVYCTAWTYFGSVGLAASQGVAFLPIYLGPTLMAALWPLLLIKILRIARTHRITSIADLLAARYGKSRVVAGLVSVIAVLGVVPYIALQLKAVSQSFSLVAGDLPHVPGAAGVFADSALYIALLMAVFAIMFGTRHIDATERHEGMVAAIAFESLVKLAAFVAAGLFVCYGLHDGVRALVDRAAADPQLARLLAFESSMGGYANWLTLTLLSMSAILLLPRQFQVAVVENVDERHVRRAVWLFPLYLLAINLFVLPIALAGALEFRGTPVQADTYVLALPLAHEWKALALFVYLGGLSAATGMIIVETTALATMVSNDLVMPLLLRLQQARAGIGNLSRALLTTRRAAIVLIVLLGFAYFRLAGEARTLVSIGLISFAAVAQLAPALLGGLYWKEATRAGALAGLLVGSALWGYTLVLPAFIAAGVLPAAWVEHGPMGLAWLRPTALLGLTGLDQMSHSVFWSLLGNLGAFVGVSLATRPDAAQSAQAALFVDAFEHAQREATLPLWRGGTPVEEVRGLLERIVGRNRARQVMEDYARRHGVTELEADAGLMQHVESVLAGSIGSASARIMVASIAREAPLSLEEVLGILDETSQAIHYGRQLEQKSRELAATTEELRRANEQLRELGRTKDDFISTVTHELRTPLTSIRAFSEILHDRPGMAQAQRQEFLGIVIKETERLTRLINQVLDLAKLESGVAEWRSERLELGEVIGESLASTARLFEQARVEVRREVVDGAVHVRADHDRVLQVLLNLLSNALKFVPAARGCVVVRLLRVDGVARVDVADNGPGVPVAHREAIFERFRQRDDAPSDPPRGTGLGLSISRQLVERMGGRLWVEGAATGGATFSFTLPLEAP